MEQQQQQLEYVDLPDELKMKIIFESGKSLIRNYLKILENYKK